MNEDFGSGALIEQAKDIARREPGVGLLLGIDLEVQADADVLLSRILALAVSPTAHSHAEALTIAVLRENRGIIASALSDLHATAVRNFEPGGEIATLLFGRGFQAVLGHRIANALWQEGRREMALAFKTLCSRAFATDIHPGATIGDRFWLDHGVGFVAGETTIIEDDVSIWHGFTLGSSLKQAGERRHPHVGRFATIGAGALLVGPVEVGEGGVVAAGSVVLCDVPAGTTVAGVPATSRTRSVASFRGFKREIEK